MTSEGGSSAYRSQSFAIWRIAVQYSYASHSARAASWFAEQATARSRTPSAPEGGIDLAVWCRVAAANAARNEAMAADILRDVRDGGPPDHLRAWHLAKGGRHFCNEAQRHLMDLQALGDAPVVDTRDAI